MKNPPCLLPPRPSPSKPRPRPRLPPPWALRSSDVHCRLGTQQGSGRREESDPGAVPAGSESRRPSSPVLALGRGVALSPRACSPAASPWPRPLAHLPRRVSVGLPAPPVLAAWPLLRRPRADRSAGFPFPGRRGACHLTRLRPRSQESHPTLRDGFIFSFGSTLKILHRLVCCQK